MKILKFNTGREYTKYGQRIAAMQLKTGQIILVDIDRRVDAMLPANVEFTQADIMCFYDISCYIYPNDIGMSYVDYYALVEQLRALANTWTNNSIN
jgi:hypothetical protein